MKRIETIKNSDYFSNIIKTGKFKKNNNYVLYYINKDEDLPKYGIAIKKKVGKAYIRNRLKRQTREIIDKHKKEFKNNNDYIIMIRDGCLNSSFKDMDASLKELLERID